MLCKTWERLYEQYERATLKRVAERKTSKMRFTVNPSELEHLNNEIAKALRQLREHESAHRCHS